MAYPDASPLGQLYQVKSQFHDLSDTLEKVCEELKAPGSPPSSDILVEMNSVITSFDELKSNVIEWAKSVQIPDIPEGQGLNSIEAITTFTKKIVAHQDHIQNEKVLRDINRARSIRHIKEGIAPLTDFRSDLDKLENRIFTPPISEEGQKDRAQILANEHPLNDLLTLVERRNELDDEKCGQISEIISEKYGATFSASALMGRLIILENQDTEEPQPSPIDAKSNTEESEPDKSKPDSADDLPVGGQAEVQAEETKSEDITDKDGITEPKEEVDPDLPAEAVSSELGFSFSASETSQSIASSLLKISDCKFERGFPDLLWALIHENHLSLAYWLARHKEKKALELPFTIPSYLIETLIHGLALQNDTGSSANCLVDIYTQQEFEFLESEEAGYDIAYRLLMVAGALRPSLLAPHTGAHTVLKSSKTLLSLDAFFAIGQAVEKFVERGSPILTDSLTAAKDDQQWQDELDSLIEKVRAWLERAPKMKMKYRPLERIWQQHFVRNEQCVHNLVSPVVNNDESKLKNVSEMIKQQYGSPHRIKSQVKSQVNHSVRHKLDCPLDPLESGMQEAVDFASQWVKLYDQKPTQKQDYHTDSIKTLRDEIQQQADTAKKELDDFAKQHRDFKPILAGVAISQKVLDAVIGLLENETPSIERDKRVLLSAELLKIPNLELTEEWAPTDEALDNLGLGLVQHVALPELGQTWEKAFEKQKEDRNHWATKHILDLMDDDETVSKLEDARQEAIDQCIVALENDIKTTEKEIGNAVLNDILTDQKRSKFAEKIEEIDPKKVLNFGLEHDSLEEIRNQLNQMREKRLDECRNQFQQLSLSKDDQERIYSVLNRGDVGTAEEFVAMLKKGEQLPDLEDNWDDKFRDFFPKAVEDFEVLSKEKKPERIIARIKSGRSIGPLRMDKVPGAQGQQAAEVLATWYELKRRRGDKFSERFKEGIGKILGWLGFEAQNTQNIGHPERSESRIWLSLTATVPSRCPIPAFGSESKGQYRLMCVWARPGEDEILDWIDQDAQGQATIVFYFGRMTVQRRRDLAHSARASCPPFLLIDENQLLFLCSERGARLPTLFDCSMPFARINPYTPFASGNVPPEMFFGREQEANSLMDTSGSCIIYGGRQLGKTALLRYVERKFENESKNHKAIFLDLKTNGIPKPRGMEALWPALGKCLREKGIISKQRRSNARDRLIDRIKEWIDDQPDRRILLLLDESDDFLAIDADDADQNFNYVSQLKGLMDNTQRRFKLVLAGLHNVQRYSHIPNQPLAHLGPPISIGPLTPRAARDLIEKPLRTLGYRFDDSSLVEMILFRMNSYPNLIQLFCNELLGYLRDRPFPPTKTPPYTISEEHIEEVYQSQDLRTKILDRFNWTLDLDKRYRFIAYSIALEIRSEKRSENFKVDWIADEARQVWPEGFGKTFHNDEIRGLLDEMIGLGILVKTNDRYRLRSPNVLRLLGTQDQIEDQLLETMEYDPPPGFDPNSFRRPLNGENDGRRSPLTFAQESDILKSENDIRLIFGSEALKIRQVFEAVKVAVEDYAGQVYSLADDVQSSTELESWLQECIGDQEEGYVVPVIPLEKAGSEPNNLIEWIETARNIVNRRSSEKRTIRILFSLSPEVTQIWLKVSEETREKLTTAGGRLLLLKRWNDAGLRHWLEDLHIAPNSDEQRKEILDATGGWPIFMEDFARYLKNEMDWKKAVEEIRKAQQERDGDYGQRFGITQMDRANQIWTTLCKWYSDPFEFRDLLEAIEEEPRIENMPPEELRQVVDYLSCLNLIESENADQFCPEPVVAAMTAGG